MVKESVFRIMIFVKSARDYITALIFSNQYAIIYSVSDCAPVTRGLRRSACAISGFLIPPPQMYRDTDIWDRYLYNINIFI